MAQLQVFVCWCERRHTYNSKIGKKHIRRAGQVPRFAGPDEEKAIRMQKLLDEGTS